MECLANELEATFHSIELKDSTPRLSVRPQRFDFICKEKPMDIKVEAVVVQDIDSKYLWKVTFNPPLKKGNKVKYAFKYIRHYIEPYTYEEVIERINRGTYAYKEPVCSVRRNIAYPTHNFSYEIDFPENYEISDCYVDVNIGEAGLKAENEVRRIKQGNMFSVEKIIDKWSMSLRVPMPLQDHTYYIFYVPPKSM